MFFLDGIKFGFVLLADVHGAWTTGMKTTARGRFQIVGNTSRYAMGNAPSRQLGYGVHEPLRVRMVGVGEKSVSGSNFDHITGIHHIQAVGHLTDNAQGVGDENDRAITLLHQLVQQSQNLILDGDIEGGAGFIGNEQLGRAMPMHTRWRIPPLS